MNKITLSPGQREMMAALKPIVQLGTSGVRSCTPFPTRLSTLIAGPTGVGKSRFVRALAAECKVPFWEARAGSWIPVGARHATSTLETLIGWIYQHKKGIIFIDEIDKISSSDSDWQVGNRQEIMSICDLRVELSAIKSDESSWPPEIAQQMSQGDARTLVKFQIEQKLADSFVIIGAGTWQSGWTGERKTIGFRGDDTHDVVLNRNQLTRSITEEILNRFRSEVHFLKPMEREDYIAVMEEIAEIQPNILRDQFVQIVIDALPEALESGKGMRLFEEAQTRLCVDLLMSCAGDEYVFRDVMTWR